MSHRLALIVDYLFFIHYIGIPFVDYLTRWYFIDTEYEA